MVFLFVIGLFTSINIVAGSTCVPDTAQCGGKGYTGLTKCCSSGSVCTYRNDYYSKCMPKTGPAPTPSSCSNKTDSQCGGVNFKGNTCCPTGLKCTYRNEWFSKCMVSSGATPTPSSCSNKTDSQCGGLNFKGNTCCPTGLKCTYRNEWFSKCMATSSPTPTPKPTTPSSCSNKTDSQCGGLNFKGNTCCPTGLKCIYRNEWFSKCMSSSTTPSPTHASTNQPTPSPTGHCPSGSVPAVYKNFNLALNPYGNDFGACDKDVIVCCPSSCGTCNTSDTCLTTSTKPECCATKAVQKSCLSNPAPCLIPQIDDPCQPWSSPCQHGGVCETFYSFSGSDAASAKCYPIQKCFCKAPYLGNTCEQSCPSGETTCGASTGYSGVSPGPDYLCCDSEKTCVSVDGKYGASTQCIPKDHPKSCTPNPCVHGDCGQPGYGSTANVCFCPSGWSGGLCQNVFNCVRSTETECGNGHNSGQGVYGNSACCSADESCVKYSQPNNGPLFFTRCELKSQPTSCSPNPCLNGGTCGYLYDEQGDGVFYANVLGCKCADQYYGQFCENKY